MKTDKIERGIILYVWAYALIASLILFIFDLKLTICFVLGVATNLLCFTTTIRTVDKVVKYKYEKPRRLFVFNNILNLAIYAVVLVVVALKYREPKYIITCFVGMLSVKIMIYVKNLVIDPIKNKRKNRIKGEM